jgi:hypothetical protein
MAIFTPAQNPREFARIICMVSSLLGKHHNNREQGKADRGRGKDE